MAEPGCGFHRLAAPPTDSGHDTGDRPCHHMASLSRLLYFSVSVLGRGPGIQEEGGSLCWLPMCALSYCP